VSPRLFEIKTFVYTYAKNLQVADSPLLASILQAPKPVQTSVDAVMGKLHDDVAAHIRTSCNEEQLLAIAAACGNRGITLLQVSNRKPRTAPYLSPSILSPSLPLPPFVYLFAPLFLPFTLSLSSFPLPSLWHPFGGLGFRVC
jgi:hypothetical protein